MIDEYIRKVLAIDVAGSIRFEHVIEVLIRGPRTGCAQGNALG